MSNNLQVTTGGKRQQNALLGSALCIDVTVLRRSSKSMTVMWLDQRCKVRSRDILSIESNSTTPGTAAHSAAARLYLAKDSKITLEQAIGVEDALLSPPIAPRGCDAVAEKQSEARQENVGVSFSGCGFWSA